MKTLKITSDIGQVEYARALFEDTTFSDWKNGWNTKSKMQVTSSDCRLSTITTAKFMHRTMEVPLVFSRKIDNIKAHYELEVRIGPGFFYANQIMRNMNWKL